MQRLLTGKKRFAGFEGEWHNGNLNMLCTLKGGNAFKEDLQGSMFGDYPFIKVSDMNLVGNETYIFTSNNWLSADIAANIRAKPFPKGSIVFAKVGAALLLNRRRILTRETIIDNNMMAYSLDCTKWDTYFAKTIFENIIPYIYYIFFERI